MKLIINADDFGLTEQVSKGILYGMEHGCITDTSAIVNTSDFMSCAKLAIDQGIHAMGIHCLITMGEPVSDKACVKSLLNDQGKFCLRRQLTKMQFDMKEVRLELQAQIERFLQSGLKLTHIDTHHGFMNHSREMAVLFQELAERYHVPLRNEGWNQANQRLFVKQSYSICETTYFNHGTPHHTYEDLTQFLKQALQQYQCVEIGCHPGYSDAHLRHISPLHDDREQELAVFLDDRWPAFLKAHEITLCKYQYDQAACALNK